ncbi:MAG TPA: hypothetical protein VES65_05525 [Solirubrobacteraceae bacterium]|nr:hypothetical protein [Solirubrobacteraceae bacterium]
MNAEDGRDQAAVFRVRLLGVLGAVAGSIGVVGFVAVVGGMVVWIRFDSLHLPADTVVASIPRTTLIVIGLSTLIPFIAIGLFAVVVAYLFAADNLVPSVPWRDVADAWSGTEAPVATVDEDSQVDDGKERIAAQLERLSQDAAALARRARSAAEFGRTKVVANEHDRLKGLRKTLAKTDSEFNSLTPAQRGALAAAKNNTEAVFGDAKADIRRAIEQARKNRKRSLITWTLTILCLALIELATVFLVGAPSPVQNVMLFFIGAFLAFGTLLVGLRTSGFVVFGVAIFMSVLLFGTATTLLHIPHSQGPAHRRPALRARLRPDGLLCCRNLGKRLLGEDLR